MKMGKCTKSKPWSAALNILELINDVLWLMLVEKLTTHIKKEGGKYAID